MREIPHAQDLSDTTGVARMRAAVRSPSARKSHRQVTCEDCYFRREGLCAIPGNTVCPTFRAVGAGALAPPEQPPLVARAPAVAAAGRVP